MKIARVPPSKSSSQKPRVVKKSHKNKSTKDPWNPDVLPQRRLVPKSKSEGFEVTRESVLRDCLLMKKPVAVASAVPEARLAKAPRTKAKMTPIQLEQLKQREAQKHKDQMVLEECKRLRSVAAPYASAPPKPSPCPTEAPTRLVRGGGDVVMTEATRNVPSLLPKKTPPVNMLALTMSDPLAHANPNQAQQIASWKERLEASIRQLEETKIQHQQLEVSIRELEKAKIEHQQLEASIRILEQAKLDHQLSRRNSVVAAPTTATAISVANAVQPVLRVSTPPPNNAGIQAVLASLLPRPVVSPPTPPRPTVVLQAAAASPPAVSDEVAKAFLTILLQQALSPAPSAAPAAAASAIRTTNAGRTIQADADKQEKASTQARLKAALYSRDR
eukprot:Sro38_g023630.2  (389) ;mRNA; f:45574-46740